LLINMHLTYENKASIKLVCQQKGWGDYAVWGALQQDVYRVLIVGLEDLKTECVPAGPVSTNN